MLPQVITNQIINNNLNTTINPLFENIPTLFNLLLQSRIFPVGNLPTQNTVSHWKQLDSSMKVKEIMIRSFMEFKNLSLAAAQKIVNEKEQYFFNYLDNDLCDDLMSIWWILPITEQKETMKHGLINLYLKTQLYLYPEEAYNTLFNRAISLFEDPEPLTLPSLLEELRLYKLKENLRWLETNHMRHLTNNPVAILKAVLIHNKHPFFNHTFWETAPNLDIKKLNYASIRSLDEAALFWNQLHTNDMFNGTINKNSHLSVKLLRQIYLPELNTAYQEEKIIDQFFKIKNSQKEEVKIFFDNFSFKNCQNYSFNDLLEYPELKKIIPYAQLPQEKKKKLLEKAMHQRGESTQYKVGSFEHSLASTIIRIFYYQHHEIPPKFNSEKQLIYTFMKLEKKWEKNRDFPIHPRLLLAMHFARSNDFQLEGTNWKEKLEYLLNNLNSRFEELLNIKNITDTPFFDVEKAAFSILRRYGIPETEINFRRKFTVMQSHLIASDLFTGLGYIPIEYFGDLIDEFLKKANIENLSNYINYQGKIINPAEELKKEKNRFNDKKNKIEIKNSQLLLLKEWWNCLPFIGSFNTIRDGIQHKNWGEVLLGEIILSLDSYWFFFGLGFNIFTQEKNLETLRLSSREKIIINSLKISLNDLDISSEELIQTGEFKLNSRPFLVSAPERLEDPDEEYLLVYLFNENRAVVVKPQGGYYREVNELGNLNFDSPLIYKDKEGRYISGGLQGGKRYNYQLLEPLSESELKQRPTVSDALICFETAKDYNVYNYFPEKFTKYFNIDKAIQEIGIDERFYEYYYIRSPTFRRMFNQFYKFCQIEEVFCREDGNVEFEDIWQIKAHSNKPTIDFKNKIIYLNPNIDKLPVYYLSDNQFQINQPFQKSRMSLHEILHAFYNRDDFLATDGIEAHALSPFKVNLAIEQTNRGFITYITDKILFESEQAIPRRMVYKAIKENSFNQADLETLKYRMIQENAFLDEKLDASIPISEFKYLAGEELSQRYTVKQVKEIFESLPLNIPSNVLSFSKRFRDIFSSENVDLLKELEYFFTKLYSKSKTFRLLCDTPDSEISMKNKWKFTEILPRSNQPLSPTEKDNVIYFVNDETHYLSTKGVVPIEKERRYLYSLLPLTIGTPVEEMPLEKQFDNRGAIAQIADKIFQEAKINYPKCLAQAFILPNDIESEKKLLSNWVDLERKARYEDRYLDQVYAARPQINCFPFPCASMSIKRNKRAKNEALLIKETMHHIRKENQRLFFSSP